MKVRAIANGNVIDLPEGHGLITAGIYVPVEEGAPDRAPTAPEVAAVVAEPEVSFTASPKLDEALETPRRSTKVAPMGTKDVPPPKRRK